MCCTFPCVCTLLQYDICLVSQCAHQSKEGNSSKAINYVLYTLGDSTNFVLSAGKSYNLEETRNRRYIFMALKTRNRHLIYDSARAEYVGRLGMLSNEVWKQKRSFQQNDSGTETDVHVKCDRESSICFNESYER